VKYIFTTLFLCSVCITSAQNQVSENAPSNWPEIPGLHHGGPITLTNEKIFIRVAGAVAITYLINKFVLKENNTTDYWLVRTSYAKGDYKTVTKQHFGIERKLAPWFSVTLEGNFQQWHDEREYIQKKDKTGFGISLQPFFRWYVFGKKRLSPYLEYGTGFFQGFEKFPQNGTGFTFTHSSHLGVEYTTKNEQKIRLSYGQYHHSNNDWWKENPGFNANGLNISYAWKI
jgi:hypothetical protein